MRTGAPPGPRRQRRRWSGAHRPRRPGRAVAQVHCTGSPSGWTPAGGPKCSDPRWHPMHRGGPRCAVGRTSRNRVADCSRLGHTGEREGGRREQGVGAMVAGPEVETKEWRSDGRRALRARLEAAEGQIRATSDILRVLASSSPVQGDVLDAIADNARRLLEADVAQLHLTSGDLVPLRAFSGLTPEFLEAAGRNPPRRDRATLVGRVTIDRTAHQIDDVLADPDYSSPEFQRLGGYRSIIGAPMVVDDEVVGVLTVWRTTVEPFDEHTRTLLVDLRRAGGPGPAQRRALRGPPGRSAELARKVDEMEALAEVGRGDQLDPRPGRGAHDDRRARRAALRRRRRLAHGVRRGEPAVPRPHDLRHERRRPSSSCKPRVRIHVDESFVGPGGHVAGCRCRSPTCAEHRARPAPAAAARRRLALARGDPARAARPDRRGARRAAADTRAPSATRRATCSRPSPASRRSP